MLHSERVDSFVLHLPGNDGAPIPVALDDSLDEFDCGREQQWMRVRFDKRAFAQGLPKMVGWDEELGIAERFQWTDAENDLFPRLLGGIDLVVELLSMKSARLGFDAIPVGSQSNDLKGVLEQRFQGGRRVQSERFDLRGTKADPKLCRATGLDGRFLPSIRQRTYGSSDPDLRDYWQRQL